MSSFITANNGSFQNVTGVINGNNNRISNVTSSTIEGNNLSIEGGKDLVIRGNNIHISNVLRFTLEGNNSEVSGCSNGKIRGNNARVSGNNCHVNGNNAIVRGEDCTVSGRNCTLNGNPVAVEGRSAVSEESSGSCVIDVRGGGAQIRSCSGNVSLGSVSSSQSFVGGRMISQSRIEIDDCIIMVTDGKTKISGKLPKGVTIRTETGDITSE